MAVVVLGTALTTLGVSPACAVETTAAPEQAVVDLSRYCTACWRNARLPADCWNDCTQEVFVRLLKKVDPATWGRLLRTEGEARKEFFRAIDAVKKRTQRSLKRSSSLVEVLSDGRCEPETRLREDWDVVQQAAGEVLTERQQRILRLSYEGWEINEIADQMSLPPERVSDEKYKAIRKLRQHLHVG